jgi:hypothetical protein
MNQNFKHRSKTFTSITLSTNINKEFSNVINFNPTKISEAAHHMRIVGVSIQSKTLALNTTISFPSVSCEFKTETHFQK